MFKLIARINKLPLALGFFLLALACFLGPGAPALAQPPAGAENRYCTWLFWSKDPALIKKALERMSQGEPFMVVARDISRQNPKTSQANADCMNAAGMDPAVLSIVGGLQIGQTSRPFDLGGGTALVMRTTDEYRRKAQELYSKGRFNQAERELLRDLKLHPASSAAWHMLALTRTAQGNYKSALDALDKALSYSPGNPAMLNDKASALANLGRAKEAAPIFEKALKLDPKNPTIMSNLAWALTLAKTNPKKAEALARQACQAAPKEARFWHTLGKIQATQGRHGEAIASLRQAILLEPKLDAASKDLILSIKALDPKTLASLDQPRAKKPAAGNAEAKEKEEAVGKGIKPAPDLAAPALELPSSWPSLPAAEKKEPPVEKAAAETKAEAKTAAEEKPKDEAAAPPSSGPRGRIVSLPMPKFPENPPTQAEDDKQPGAGKAEPPKEPAEPPKAEPKPEPAAPKSTGTAKKTETPGPPEAPAKAEPKAEAKAGQAQAQPEKPAAPAEPAPRVKEPIAEKTEAKPAAAPEEPKAPDKKEAAPAQAEAEAEAAKAKPATEAEQDAGQGKFHYLIQVASFRPEELAQKELSGWTRRGQPGIIEKWQGKSGRTWHRVLLGPFADKESAERKAQDLKAKKWVRDYHVVERPAQ